MISERFLIDGELILSTSNEDIQVFNPSSSALVGTVPKGTKEDALLALNAAEHARKGWAKLPAQARAQYLYELADILESHKSELAQLLTSEQGKPVRDALGEVDASCMFLRYAAESARRIEGEILTSEIQDEQTWIQRVPYGVVVGIVAWNFPLALTARKIGNALVCGNTMVVKPPSETPLTVMRFAAYIAQSSLPKGVINFVTGSGSEVGDALVRSEITKLVTLTGSTNAGKQVFRASADHVAVVRLELGGKAPFIVMDDCDIEKAVECAVISKFANGGQICTCNDRMYIHERIYEDFVERLIRRIKRLRVGDPLAEDTDIGPKVNRAEVDKLNKMLEKSKAQGAKVLLDMGENAQRPTAEGNWFYPVICEIDDNSNILMQEETFGPILPIMRVTSFDEAVSCANDSIYGLSAYLFTNNAKHIMRAVSELEFGEVYINRENGELINAFHNGFKQSGIGGEDGVHGLEGYLQKKTLYMNYSD